MHPNPAFRQTPEARTRAFAAARGFGVLTVAAADPASAPLAAHIPFELLDADPDQGSPAEGAPGRSARFHLVRSNPIARLLADGRPRPALLVASGPDAYVSPMWYGPRPEDAAPDQVPTWNYVAAHLRGAIRLLPVEALRPHLERVSAHFEGPAAARTGLPAWRVDKMSADGFARLARQIVPAEMAVETIDGTWKLSQNKPPKARDGARARIASLGLDAPGSAPAVQIARLMASDDPSPD